MKILANVCVNHRQLPSFNLPSRRSRRSSLALWKKGKDDVYLTVQSNDDKAGVKYKIKDNVERVFGKFAKEGKASVIFKDPPHELLINCEATHLVKFLQLLKLVLGGKEIPFLPSTNPQPLKKLPPKQPAYVTITQKEDYPVLNGFPRHCTHVKISGIEEKVFDVRLLGLSELEILDLSDNALTYLPAEIDLLPKLKSLNLCKNKFAYCLDWSWMCGDNIAKTLEVLDLSYNKLVVLPACIRRLGSLHTLRLNNNTLLEVNPGIGMLRKLRILSLSCNHLFYLPGSFAQLRLQELDVAGNLFSRANATDPANSLPGCPSLKELAARVVVDHRMQVKEHDLPRTLHQYLDEAKLCVCGRAIFDWCVEYFAEYDLNLITSHILVVDLVVTKNILLKMCLCSWKCILHSYGKGK